MTKLIIVEGMNNTGKSTLINQYKQVRTSLNSNVKIEVISMESPAQDVPNEKLSEVRHKAYISMVSKLLNMMKSKTPPDYIIIDGSWLSEYVYEPYYRKHDKMSIVVDNLVIEKKVLDIFGSDNVYLVFLYTNNLDFIRNNDDGKSLAVITGQKLYPDIYVTYCPNFPGFSEKTPTERKKERNQYIKKSWEYENEEFRYCFDNLTIIKNKIPIKANRGISKTEFDNSMLVQMFDFIHNQ